MPFYIIPKNTEPEQLDAVLSTAEHYDTRRDAHANCPDKHEIYFRIIPSEKDYWQGRERDRFLDGTYTYLPWQWPGRYPQHFAHLSANSPGKIAYTPSDEHGLQDRQIVVRPGKYLEEFYSDLPLTERERMIAECEIGQTASYALATTADDVETVYRNAVGFCSCMGPDEHETFDLHPSRVYGDSDLAVAYLGPIDAAVARCVVWPERKRYGRAYGQSSKLTVLLENDGYTSGSLHGARIRRIEYGDGYLMPYIDGPTDAGESHCGRYLVLGHGAIDTQVTTGSTRTEPLCRCEGCDNGVDEVSSDGYCDSCEETRSTCQNCDDRFWDDEMFGEYCQSCDEELNTCEICEDRSTDSTVAAVSSGQEICRSCARHNEESVFHCAHCDVRVAEWDLDEDDQIRRDENGIAFRLCLACEDTATICHACGHAYEPETDTICPACDVPERCPDTLPLPLDIQTAETEGMPCTR